MTRLEVGAALRNLLTDSGLSINQALEVIRDEQRLLMLILARNAEIEGEQVADYEDPA